MDHTELPVVAIALGVVLVARFVDLPASLVRYMVPLVLVMGAIGLMRNNRLLIGLALVLVVMGRGAGQVAALAQPLPVGVVAGEVQIMSDPTQRDFDVRAIVSYEGRRYMASMASQQATEMRSTQVGEVALVRGTVGPIDGAPHGWVVSNHLAGRMRVESLTRLRDAPPWYRVANGVRGVIARSGSSFAPDDRALYLGLVVGDDRGQSELQKYRFRASGLSHLLAVSGQNVAFVLAIVAPLTRRLGPRWASVAAVPVLLVFVLVTRAEPSVLRAVTMASTGLLAVVTGRRIQTIRMLALTVIVLVTVDPAIVHSMAFTLSVSATLGLILLAGPIAARLPGPTWLTEALAVTIAAQLATAPVLFTMTGSLPSVATPANLLAVPVSGFVMMAGLTVGLLAGSIRADLGAVLMWPVGLMVRWVDRVADVASRVPTAPLGPVRMLVLVVVGAAATMALANTRRSTRRHGRNGGSVLVWAVRAVCVTALVVMVLPVPPRSPRIDLDGGAVFHRDACGTHTVTLVKGVAGTRVLESLDALEITTVDFVITDRSRSAQRVLSYLQAQYQDITVLDPTADRDRGPGTNMEERSTKRVGPWSTPDDCR